MLSDLPPLHMYYRRCFSKVCIQCTNLLVKISSIIVAPVSDCVALQMTVDVVYVITASAASFLFLLRIQAVFHKNLLMRSIFFVL